MRAISWICTDFVPLKSFPHPQTCYLAPGNLSQSASERSFSWNTAKETLACLFRLASVGCQKKHGLRCLEAKDLRRLNLRFKARFRRDRNLSTDSQDFHIGGKIQYNKTTCKQTEEKYPGKHFSFMRLHANACRALKQQQFRIPSAFNRSEKGVLMSASSSRRLF